MNCALHGLPQPEHIGLTRGIGPERNDGGGGGGDTDGDGHGGGGDGEGLGEGEGVGLGVGDGVEEGSFLLIQRCIPDMSS